MPITIVNTPKVNRKSGAYLRFWSFVDKNGPLIIQTKCWIWNGPKREEGYGRFRVNCRKTEAHRYSYELHKGKIPDGLQILHACDNPGCVNPEHLSAGTISDNMRDMVAKNRQARGMRKPASKLTNEQVLDIRKRYIPYCDVNGLLPLARKYGVSGRTIYAIVHREQWTHI